MAFLIMKDNSKKTLPAKQAALLWRIQQGELAATPEQKAKAGKVAKFYFNRATAPQSWLDSHPALEGQGSYSCMMGKRA